MKSLKDKDYPTCKKVFPGIKEKYKKSHANYFLGLFLASQKSERVKKKKKHLEAMLHFNTQVKY